MYGAQTRIQVYLYVDPFENDVEMYGAQTNDPAELLAPQFENDVEMYGAQTQSRRMANL